jgi:hypothetical protein
MVGLSWVEPEGKKMTLRESINHGYNLMVTAVLLFGGLAFGTLVFNPAENDWFDRLDDIALPLIGIACLVWFLSGRNRFRRSIVPLVLVGLALVLQLVAVPLERDDMAAFGDNIGGLVLLLPFFVFALVYYLRVIRPVHLSEGGV